MNDVLATGIMIGSLIVAAWCFVAVARDRLVDLTHLVGLALLEVALVVQAVWSVVQLSTGHRPAELATFIGYLVTSVLAVPATVALSLAERTKWGTVIAGSGALVVAALVLRLQQVWLS